MITKNPMQLKAFVKNKAKESGISAQLAYAKDIAFEDTCHSTLLLMDRVAGSP